MIFKVNQLGCWEAEKTIECTDEEKITYFVECIIQTLKKLNESSLFIATEYRIMTKTYSIDNKHIYDRQFWLDALNRDTTRYYCCFFEGNTLLYENAESDYYSNALLIDIDLETSIHNEITLSIAITVKADNFAPNFIINRVEPNPDYEKNHGRLHQFLKWLINQGFDVSRYHDDHDTATLVDLEIHNYVQDYEIVMYTDCGTPDDWFSIYDIDFRGKLHNIKDQLS